MAKKNVGGISIDLGLNLKNFNKGIKDSAQETKKLQVQIKQVRETLKLKPDAFDDLNIKTKLFGRTVEAAKKHISNLEATMRNLKDNNVDETNEKFILLSKSIAKAKTELKDLERSFQISSTKNPFSHIKTGLSEIISKGGFSIGQSQLTTASIIGANLASRAIAGLYNQTKSLGQSIFDVGIGFEEALASLRGLYGDEITTEEFQKVIDKARELGVTSRYNSVVVANSMRAMALAGYDANDTINSIKASLDLASASGEDFGIVSSILVDGLKAFGYTTDKASYFADILGTTAVVTNADVNDLGESFKYVGALAGTFKYDIRDISVALGAMAANGIKGSIAGTALRQMILRLSTDSSGALKLFKSLGGEFYDVEGKALPLIDVLNSLRTALKGKSDDEKANILSTIASTRGITGLSAIVGFNDSDWDKLIKSLENAEGAVGRIAETRLDNLAGDTKKLSNAWQDAKLTIFDAFQPSLRKLAQEFTKMLKSAEFKKDTVNVTKTVFGIFKTGINIIKFLAQNIKLLSGSLKVAIPTAYTFKTAMSFTNTMTALGKSVGMADDRLISLSKSLTSTSLGLTAASLIISSSIVLINGLVEASQKQFEKLNTINEKNKEAKKSVEELTESNERNATSLLVQQDHYKDLTNQLDLYVDADGRVLEGKENHVNFILDQLNDAYGLEYKLIDGVIPKYGELKQKIEELSEAKLRAAFSEDETNLLIENQKALQQYTTSYSQALQEKARYIQELNENFKKNMGNYGKDNFYMFGIYEENNKLDEMKAMTDSERIKFLTDNFDKISYGYASHLKITLRDTGALIDETTAKIADSNKAIETLHTEGVESYLEEKALKQIGYNDLTNESLEQLRLNAELLKTELSTMVENDPLQDVLQKQLDILDVEIKSREEKLKQVDKLYSFKDILQKFNGEDPNSNVSLNFVNSINQNLKDNAFVVQEGSQEVTSQMKIPFDTALTETSTFGLNYVSGISSSLKANTPIARNAATQLANAINAAFKAALKIKSPSRVAYESASWFAIGVGNSLVDGIPIVEKASTRLASSVADSYQKATKQASQSIDSLETKTNVSNMFVNAVKGMTLVVKNNVDIDGREVANRVSNIHGLQLKKEGV